MQTMEASSEAEDGSRGSVAYSAAAIPFVSGFACIFELGRPRGTQKGRNLGSFLGW